jgi:hypothetical protein
MKIFSSILLLVMVLSLAAVAAPATPVKKVTTSTTASSGSTMMGLTGVTLTSIGCPAAHFGMGGWSMDIGGSIANAANTTTITVFGSAQLPLSKVNDNLVTYWGPGVLYNSTGNGTVTIAVLIGAEYMFAPNLTLFADMTAFSLTSANGATNWVVGQNNPQVYTGGRLYF